MTGMICWVEWYDEGNEVKTDVIALTCRSYIEATQIIEDLYRNDLVSMKLFALEDEVIHINDDIAKRIIDGEFF